MLEHKQHDVDGAATGADNPLGWCRAMEKIVSARSRWQQPGLASCGCRSGSEGIEEAAERRRGCLRAVGAVASGPISEAAWTTREVPEEFWDTVNGVYLNGNVVRAARAEEREGVENAEFFLTSSEE